MDDFDALWRGLDGGEQSAVRRAARTGRAVEDRIAPHAVAYARRRLARWWLDLAEIAPAVTLLLVLPLFARRRLGILTADDQWPARAVGIVIVVVAFVGWRRWRYASAVRLNDGRGEPEGSR